MVKENSSHSIAKKGNQEIEQAQDNQTPGEICQINLRPNARVESIWKQGYDKDSIKKLGDANYKYFSAIIKERTQRKPIRDITSLDGQMLYEPQEIQNEFVLFYKSLMGTSSLKLPAIDVQNGKGKTKTAQIFKIILAEGIYELWIERNNRIFEKKSKMEENVAKEIAYVTIARAPANIKNDVNEFKF
ncbi:hypothetical protein RDI58_012389 [Solanum bulbocastanum]|uniref:Uncharacterized protein n=1 Tax=Solanum bulbocastanum TaxID=147425 RepID=A0AAN8YEB9_SOLBU